MTLERGIESHGHHYTIHNKGYNYISVMQSAPGILGPVLLMTIPKEILTEFIGALLEVQEDSHAMDRNRNND